MNHFQRTAERAQLADTTQPSPAVQRIALTGVEMEETQGNAARAIGDAASNERRRRATTVVLLHDALDHHIVTDAGFAYARKTWRS